MSETESQVTVKCPKCGIEVYYYNKLESLMLVKDDLLHTQRICECGHKIIITGFKEKKVGTTKLKETYATVK